MKLQDAIGGTVRELRTERHLTLTDLSRRAFVSQGFLSEVERGLKMASPEVLESIAVGLSLTTAELIKEIYEYLQT